MEEKETHTATPKPKKIRVLKLIGRLILGLPIGLFLLILFIRSPWGQSLIVDKLTTYISQKTQTKVEIGRLFLSFDGNLNVEHLFLEDQKGDTLVYSKSLEANLPLWMMIRGKGVGIDALKWEGLRANIIRKDSILGYNFQFLMDAFASEETEVKDTTSTAPITINIGKLQLKDFDIVFDDVVAGIDSRFKIGAFRADMKTVALEHLLFEANLLELSEASVSVIQTPTTAGPTESTSGPLPHLAVERLKLNKVQANYQSADNQLSAHLNINTLLTKIPTIDLSANRFKVDAFQLDNSDIIIQTAAHSKEQNPISPSPSTSQNLVFEWPDLELEVDNVELQNNKFSLFSGSAKPIQNHFNPNALVLDHIDLKATKIGFKEKAAAFEIDHFNFQEASGLNLKALALQFSANDTHLQITNLATTLNHSTLAGAVSLEYPTLGTLINQPEKAKLDLNIPRLQLALEDALPMAPELENTPYFTALKAHSINGNFIANGYLSDLNLIKLTANWSDTQLSAQGKLRHVTNPSLLEYDFPDLLIATKSSDLTLFFDESEFGIQVPEHIKLKATLAGNLNKVASQATITTTQGMASIEGLFENGPTLTFESRLAIVDYDLSALLQDETLGPLSLSIDAKGHGKTLNDLNVQAKAMVDSFKYNHYDIRNLNLESNIINGQGKITSAYKDANLDALLNADVVLDTIRPEIRIQFHVIGANLKALGLMDRDIRTALKINADFKGNAQTFDLASTVEDGVFVFDNKTYLLDHLKATAHVSKDTTSVLIKNNLIDAQLQSNSDPMAFTKALKHHVFSYFNRKTPTIDTLSKPVRLMLKGKIAQAPILKEVFLVNVKDLDTVSIDVKFMERKRRLQANITAPHINYSGFLLDSLAFSMNTDADQFVFDLGFNRIKAGLLDIQKTQLQGNQHDNALHLNFLAYHNQAIWAQIKSEITGDSDQLRFHVDPQDLILNQSLWETPEENAILVGKNKIVFNQFKFSRPQQSIEITDTLPELATDHIAVHFEDFKLHEFVSYLNPDKEIATGNLNGNFILENPFNNTGILADLDVSKLKLLQIDLGHLDLNAKSLGNNSYDFNIDLNGGDIDLDLTGDYLAVPGDAHLNLDLAINQFNMKALSGLSQGEITETDGSFSGNFEFNGTLSQPEYSGFLNFKDAKFKIKTFNSPFILVNETLFMNNLGMTMDQFTIRDQRQNPLVISGSIGQESLINPTFDLKITADNFQVMNATNEDNDFLYGNITFDADMQLTGNLNLPKVNLKANLSSETDVTYVLPSASVNLEERDGVVSFVNRENPNAILTDTDQKATGFTGMDLSALITIGKDAAVTLIIDTRTGDHFKVSGKGDLVFNMKPNGNTSLAGIYEVTSGHYELNLYGIVNRKFDLVPGSRVSWSGDPLDAKMDISALYQLKTSASPMMAPTSSNMDPATKAKYRQALPFEVYLNIDGQLMEPHINFSLDMPKEEQGAINGQVYSRVQQLNQQEDELNRQVFSLLVLNRFYPDPGSDGSTGGVAAIARNNINEAISDQLNMFSDKLLGNTGFELNFGLDSYTDYQGSVAQDRTQLEIEAQKKLFNDRLIVSVGSEIDVQGSNTQAEETPLIGNFSIEYLLTESGRYRLKGFHRNEYENLIDGQTVVSGIALIFTQEFNKFHELWEALIKSKTTAEKEAEEKQNASHEKP